MIPAKPKSTASKLLIPDTKFDSSNELADKLEHQYNTLQEKLNGKSEQEIREFFKASVNDKELNELASGGFLFGILTDPPNARKHFLHLGLAVNDGWYQVLLKMNMILLEILYKLKPQVRQQIMFFFSESIKSNIPKIDNVMTNLLRSISEGTDYKETCATAHGTADILNANKDWMRSLKPAGTFAPVALITFSRLISDQQQFGSSNNDSRFKNSMISLCEFILKERFSDVVALGRDLLLVMMRLSKIPQFLPYWKSLLHNPGSLLPNFNGIPQLMATHCPNVWMSFRVSLHVSRKVDFMLRMKVHEFMQHKNINWFRDQHLSNVDRGSLMAEVMRYIWGNIAEYQQPFAIETRAHLLAWLLKSARPGAELQWCKLMLFFDWFGFDPKAPNALFYVEPGFSVIKLLISSPSPTGNPHLANSLLDFLIRMTSVLYPPLTPYFVNSISSVLISLGEAGMPVLQVLENPRFDKPVRDAFRETFPNVFPKRPNLPDLTISPQMDSTDLIVLDSGTVTPNAKVQNPPNFHAQTSSANMQKAGDVKVHGKHHDASSKKDREVKKKKVKRKISSDPESGGEDAKEPDIMEIIEEVEESPGPSELQDLSVVLPLLREEFKEQVEELSNAVIENAEEAGDAMQNLITAIQEDDDVLDEDQSQVIAECLIIIFNDHFKSKKFFPADDPSVENLNEFFDKTAFYAIFRQLCIVKQGDSSRTPLLMILSEMREKCTFIGYLMLLYIRTCCTDVSDELERNILSVYIEFCKSMETRMVQKVEEKQLVEDLEQCSRDDHKLFAFLLPFVYSKMSNVSVGSAELMHLVCRSIDTRDLADLVGEIVRENITLFRKDTFPHLLLSSLNWESIEQMMLWQLINAESVPLEWVVGLIPALSHSKHAEAVTNIMLMMKTMDHEPNMGLVRHLMCRQSKDLIVTHALKILIDDDDNLARMAQLLNMLFKKAINNNEIMKSSAQEKQKSTKKLVTAEHIFAHLEQFRDHCLLKESRQAEKFLSNQLIQEMFTLIKRDSKSAELKAKFSELDAMIGILGEQGTASTRSRKNRMMAEKDETPETKIKRRKLKNESDDDDR
ncbi:integrator complex subunit 3 domain-containing protein [Ditylenchus destructor]|uniref:SOSS complex subunit A homolog n=1 Tax=Ditylenchus destructor TaxID=166010 RepID=A0AAD4R3A7_9BILA|nr:integrator complex subunit 3 domain-containing protein [Ditylenchus destructor]